MAYLLLCLVQFYCNVSLESNTLRIVEHPKTGDDNWIKDFEMHADHSVFWEHRSIILWQSEGFNFLIQN